jgi:hypothetical protein
MWLSSSSSSFIRVILLSALTSLPILILRPFGGGNCRVNILSHPAGDE